MFVTKSFYQELRKMHNHGAVRAAVRGYVAAEALPNYRNCAIPIFGLRVRALFDMKICGILEILIGSYFFNFALFYTLVAL